MFEECFYCGEKADENSVPQNNFVAQIHKICLSNFNKDWRNFINSVKNY